MKNIVCSILALTALAGAAKPILVINEDNDHYFKLSSDLMSEEALKAYVDDICRGPVTHFFMCPQGQRTSYDSKVWEPIWKGIDEPDHDGRTNNLWCVNAKKLFDAGIDPYRVWIDRVRARGVSPWMSMRMNDIHFCTISNYFRNTTFYKAHPEWRRVPGVRDGAWEQFALDYAVREVYDYHLAMAKELIERYDVDGLELDWMRFPWYFKPGEQRRQATVLTDFIRDVRAFADQVGRRRGKRILIGARVPALPAACAGLGMDVDAWVGGRLVDWLIVHNFHHCVDFEIPFVAWRARLMKLNPDLVLLPGCDHKYGLRLQGAVREAPMTAAAYRGWAESLYAQGAEGLYLFNMPYNDAAVRDVAYGGGLSASGVSQGRRNYFPTWHDVLPLDSLAAAPLPQALRHDVFIPVRLGRPPTDGGTVTLAFDRDLPALADLVVQLNGEAPLGPPQELSVKAYAFADAKKVLRYRFASAAFVAAENGVSIRRIPTCPASVTWCEISAAAD